MSKKSTSRLKCNPPLGRMPVPAFIPPSELQVDPAYQRSLDTRASQKLILDIAINWHWDMCQMLVVARRPDGGLFVIDGQHRLAAARLRGDIGQLPCVVVDHASAASEAQNFVAINQKRKPLSRLDVFQAALASGNPVAEAINAAMEDAGLTFTRMNNPAQWKPGMVSNIAGIQHGWHRHGAAVSRAAMLVLAQGFKGQKLQYAGTIYPGIVAVCAKEMPPTGGTDHVFAGDRFSRLCAMLSRRSQAQWRRAIALQRAQCEGAGLVAAAQTVLLESWAEEAFGYPTPAPALEAISQPNARELDARIALRRSAAVQRSGKIAPAQPVWCDQCDQRKAPQQVAACTSQFCKAKQAA